MSCRTPLRLGLAAFAVAALAACNDTTTQPQSQIDPGPPATLTGLVTTTCKTKEIYQIVTWLTPLRDAPMDLRGPATVALTFSTTKQALARQIVMRLAEAITPAVIDKLNTPPASSTLGKQEAVALFIADIMECAGIPAKEAPPPAAYGPSGGLKVIDEAGGQLLSRDKEALFDVPGTTAEGGPAVVGPHLFAMAEVTLGGSGRAVAASASALCLPPRENVMEVGRCYDFSVTPDVGAHALGQGFGGRGVYTAVCSPGGINSDHTANPDDEVHNYLELAKVNHEDPTKFTIYERQQSTAAAALECDLGAGPPPPTTSALGGAWSKLAGALAVLARPFTPTIAHASDGIGHNFLDYTRARLVYRTRPFTVTPESSAPPLGRSIGVTAAPTDRQSARPGPYVWAVNGVPMGRLDLGTLTNIAGLSAAYRAPTSLPGAPVNVCVWREVALADRGCALVTIPVPTVGVASVLSNGTVALGVNPTAELNVEVGSGVVGLQYVASHNDGISNGCYCEGWGVAATADVAATTGVTGFADRDRGGTQGLTVLSFARDGSRGTSVVGVGSTLRVTHDFRPSPSTSNLYAIDVTIENVSAADIGNVRYRRVADWDVPPTTFNELVTIRGSSIAAVLATNNNGFAFPDPLSSRTDNLFSAVFTGDFVDAGPADHGALFDLTLGSLAAGASKTFTIYYGAAGTETDALAALKAVKAEVYSLGQPSDAASTGIPNTFILAFSGLGGPPLVTSRAPSGLAPRLNRAPLRSQSTAPAQPNPLNKRP